MIVRNRTTELLRHLGQVAALLWALAGSLSSSVAAPFPRSAVPSTWVSVTTATVETDSSLALDWATARVLDEINNSQSILRLQILRDETVFPAYVDAVEAALAAYDDVSVDPHSMLALASSLELARASLAQQVNVLASWLALVRTVSPDAPRYGAIPARFVAPPCGVIAHELPPTADELVRAFEFDALEAV